MHRFSSILIQTSEAIEIINWISTAGGIRLCSVYSVMREYAPVIPAVYS